MGNLKQYLKNLVCNHRVKRAKVFYEAVLIQPSQLSLKSSDRCLILSPHPDDESIGCGGLLLQFKDQCEVICLTDGQKGSEVLGGKELVEIRNIEFKAAMRAIGIEQFSLLKGEDQNLLNEYEIFKQIDFNHYEYVFIPNWLDTHIDHMAVAVHLHRLLKESKESYKFRIVFYEVWSPLSITNFILNISDVIAQKKSIIDCYKSQIETTDYVHKITSLNAYRGMQFHYDYAEAYLVLTIPQFLDVFRNGISYFSNEAEKTKVAF